ncbi:MAG: hypothetical protein FJX68_08015 [Alphaproteobacteria bacterium]|nr:hypothetical protein [Alphaproteobacteria bacterium]
MAAHFRGETQRLNYEMRYRRADGAWGWARQHGTSLRDAAGRVVRMVGSTGDITAEKQLGRQLDEERTRLGEAIEAINEGFALFDANDRLALCNSTYRRFFTATAPAEVADPVKPGMRFEDYVRLAHSHGMYPDVGEDFEGWLAMRLEHRRNPKGLVEVHMRDGTWLHASMRRTHDGRLVATYTDITQLKQRELEAQAAKTRAETALHDLRRAQDRLVQSEKMASLGQLTAGIAHEIKNPLNFVNNFAELSRELLAELAELLRQQIAAQESDLRQEAEGRLADLDTNLGKIAEHGARADRIVKNMLLHSRHGPGERANVAWNAIVEESLNLAYHGARAEKRGFNIVLHRQFDPRAGNVDAYPQELTRVFLNLFANGFYAADKRAQAAPAGFAPTLWVSTSDLGDHVEHKVRDNGIGIAPQHRQRLFTPFFTTKPPGEGTGLRLSLSYDIVVKQHAGTIAVDSQAGEFTEFTVTLPRRAGNGGGR